MTNSINPIIGVHSPLEAKMVEQLGGECIWASGYSISAACFGLPDLDIAEPNEKLKILERVIDASSLECVVDIDSGLEDDSEFSKYLNQLSELGPSAVCIEDERLPKISALYSSDKPLISSDEFLDRLELVADSIDCKIWARTNSIVRGYDIDLVLDRIRVLTESKLVSAIVLHGSDLEKIAKVVNTFPQANFYLITSLLNGDQLAEVQKMRFQGLIFGHDMIFSAVIEQTKIIQTIIQQGYPKTDREQAKKVINVLLDAEQEQVPIEEEMQAYYNSRAEEYDEWYLRLNRYNKGKSLNRTWFENLDQLESILSKIENENVIEFASGTGRWTSILANNNQVLPTDTSINMLSICEKKTQLKGRLLDVFSPLDKQYLSKFSLCFCAFWISHVPKNRVDEFMERAISSLKGPSSKAVIVDSYFNPTELNCLNHKNDVQLRALNTGEAFNVYKHYYTADELNSIAKKYFTSWDIEFTDNYFFVLTGTL